MCVLLPLEQLSSHTALQLVEEVAYMALRHPSFTRQECLGSSLLTQVASQGATTVCELQSRCRCFHHIFQIVDTVLPSQVPQIPKSFLLCYAFCLHSAACSPLLKMIISSA